MMQDGKLKVIEDNPLIAVHLSNDNRYYYK
jgi:hypothetical protein